jgi:K+:H+ antiporter
MVFFLSIGLMVDRQFIISKAFIIFGLVVIVLPAKTIVNLVALRLLGVPARQALIASAVMAQLGEFGFVLAAAGLSVGAIAGDGYQIALSVIALSLAVSPLWTAAARRIVAHPKADGDTARELLANVFASEIGTTPNMLDAVVSRLKNTQR